MCKGKNITKSVSEIFELCEEVNLQKLQYANKVNRFVHQKPWLENQIHPKEKRENLRFSHTALYEC